MTTLQCAHVNRAYCTGLHSRIPFGYKDMTLTEASFTEELTEEQLYPDHWIIGWKKKERAEVTGQVVFCRNKLCDRPSLKQNNK
jgi:hypothetical protein